MCSNQLSYVAINVVLSKSYNALNFNALFFCGWGTRIRTWGWRDQNPLPYRLAIPHPTQAGLKWCGRRDLNSYTLRRQNLNLVRLPISPLPPNNTIKSGGYDGIRTCDPIIMSDVL